MLWSAWRELSGEAGGWPQSGEEYFSLRALVFENILHPN